MDYCSGGEFYRMLKSQPEKRLCEEVSQSVLYAMLVVLICEFSVGALLLRRSFVGLGISSFLRLHL